MAYVDEDLIEEFLIRSIKGDWEGYDWEEFFTEMKELLAEVLCVHGIEPPDRPACCIDFWENWYIEVYGERDLEERLAPFEWKTDFLYLDWKDILRAILRYRCEEAYEVYDKSDVMIDLYDLYKEVDEALKNLDKMPLPQKIILADKCVHAQHHYGDILEEYGGVDIEEVKERVEEMYRRGEISAGMKGIAEKTFAGWEERLKEYLRHLE